MWGEYDRENNDKLMDYDTEKRYLDNQIPDSEMGLFNKIKHIS